MVQFVVAFLFLLGGKCWGLGGREPELAPRSAMTNWADMPFGEAAVVVTAEDQIAPEGPAQDEARLALDMLMKRQLSCPSGNYLCTTGDCCPIGWDCVSNHKCCPAGQKHCPGGFCRMSTEQCCENGSCDKDTTCCGEWCCNSLAYCGADKECQPCPPATRTRTSTTTTTSTTTSTATATEDPAAGTEDAPEFSCVPMTVTNAKGATLELGDDCALKYEPPGPTTSASSPDLVARNAPASEERQALASMTNAPPFELLPRQLPCSPFSTVTRTEWVTRSATRTATTTRTVRGPAEEEGFSCPDMEVTNAVGDTLAMDESCALSFTPAELTGDGGVDDSGSPPARGLMVSVSGLAVAAWAAWLLV